MEGAKTLLIRLAKELDGHLDLATLYSRKADSRANADPAQMIDLADALGLPRLSAALAAVYERLESASVPPDLRSKRRSSHLV